MKIRHRWTFCELVSVKWLRTSPMGPQLTLTDYFKYPRYNLWHTITQRSWISSFGKHFYDSNIWQCFSSIINNLLVF